VHLTLAAVPILHCACCWPLRKQSVQEPNGPLGTGLRVNHRNTVSALFKNYTPREARWYLHTERAVGDVNAASLLDTC
jgi:hypothetical protein